MAEHCTTIRVRYADTDQSGAVYHANYVIWFEAGRSDTMREHGVPYAELERLGILLPVMDLHVRYHRPARYDQLVEVWTHVAELTRSKVRFGYSVRLPGDSQPLATGHTLHPFVDKDNRILRMDRYPELWEQIQSATARLMADGG